MWGRGGIQYLSMRFIERKIKISMNGNLTLFIIKLLKSIEGDALFEKVDKYYQ